MTTLLKQRKRRHGAMQAFRFGSGMALHIADFIPSETIERRFESETPVIRFYFHLFASGYWELRSPYRAATKDRLVNADNLSCVHFYPQLEGKMVLPVECRQYHLSIYITQALLDTYLGDHADRFPNDLRAISEGCVDQGFYHAGSLSAMMQFAIQQLFDCPYTGSMKALYLESKAMELVAHKLAQIALPPEIKTVMPPVMDSHETLRLHRAEEILRHELEQPPTLSELAHRVGTNHCRLNQGFRQLYGTTAFGYLRHQRMLRARQLLEEDKMSVTDAALSVGYASLSSFSKAFTTFFGRQPVTCRQKK
jgi:AraC family transcriptional regulator, transcriptional activator of the genes for pyochelin and ferripyochelin receptors